MLRFLAIAVLMILNTLTLGTAILLGGLVKFLTFGAWRRRVILALASIAELWVAGNDRIFDAFLDTEWQITGLEGIQPHKHYLVVANHITWVDIFAVLRAFHGRTAFIRFFLKQVLIWFPIVGQACWALEFPFMRRYTPEYLKQHPEKRGRDLQTTRRFCQRYRRIPVAILNFVEGTRFTREKHEDQQSPYRHLLRPRIGGISFVLASLADQLDGVIDVTIVYPRRDVTLWDFVTNQLPWVKLDARLLEIPDTLRDPAITEPGPARERLKEWVEELWSEKDTRISEMLAPTTTPQVT